MEEKTRLVSVYNEAVMQMQRLHNIWLSCATSKEQGNINNYEHLLRTAETELKYDAGLLSESLEKNHESNYITKLDNINKKIKKSNLLILKTTQNSFYQQAAINRKWEFLIEKEELLREIQEESGKGGKRSNPEDDDELD